ncbi:TNT domain-containing protein [Kitasatospora sp. NPDC056327]|uniref:TNT domain-containing protein n=1 Tax=Kitasatospora sp. NPDC056327 TaxID=3345785 RepID=UPI0035D79023
MRSRNLAALALAAALLATGTVGVQSASADAAECPREQYRPTADDLAKYYCGFKELGPKTLPGNLGHLLDGYARFGGLRPGQFLSWYRDGLDWKYPGDDGFRDVDGSVDRADTRIAVDTRLDRFGSPDGRYLSRAGTSFPKRALPPDSLNPVPGATGAEEDSYHCYVVLKQFDAEQGRIASAFAQPGDGVQQYLNDRLKPVDLGSDRFSVTNLVKHGYLEARSSATCLDA